MNCVLTCGLGRACACLAGSGWRLEFRAGLRVLGSTVMVVGAACHRDAAAARLRGLRRSLRALGQRAAQGGHVDCAIGSGNNGADLGQVGIVQHERFVLGRDAIQNAVRFGARQQPALGVHGQASDVRLAGIVIQLAFARRFTR